MKKQYSIVLLLLINLLGLSAGAQENKLVAKVPYEFVAAGKTLPAGTYTISQVSAETQRVLEIRNNETPQDSAFLLPISSDAAVDHAELNLEHVGDAYYLSRIATLGGVYNLAIPKAATGVAQVKQHDGMSSAGTN